MYIFKCFWFPPAKRQAGGKNIADELQQSSLAWKSKVVMEGPHICALSSPTSHPFLAEEHALMITDDSHLRRICSFSLPPPLFFVEREGGSRKTIYREEVSGSCVQQDQDLRPVHHGIYISVEGIEKSLWLPGEGEPRPIGFHTEMYFPLRSPKYISTAVFQACISVFSPPPSLSISHPRPSFPSPIFSGGGGG